MITLRPYQSQAIEAIFDYYTTGPCRNGLVSMPVGSGKSIVMAQFIKETLTRWPTERMMLVTHVRELIEQDSAKLLALGVDCGVYSAGLKRREIHQITVGGIQSIHKKAHECGDISILIVDEAHLIGHRSESMYVTFIEDLRKYCPHVKVLGFTATPWRLQSGSLIKGKHKIFDDIIHHVGLKELMDAGYLCRLVNGKTKRLDASSVTKRGGEYVADKLEQFVDKEELTRYALDEVDLLAPDRGSILFFCCGVHHAFHVSDAFRARGHSCEVVVGDTPSDERTSHIANFKAGKIRALISVGVLSTGFDAANIDAIVMLRPTMSPGLFVQMMGRGTRPHPNKDNTLVLDFTDNTRIHGPIDLISIDAAGDVKTAECKVCDGCGGLIPSGDKVCPDCGRKIGRPCPKCLGHIDYDLTKCPTCGYEPEKIQRKISHNIEASDSEIISDGKPLSRKVDDWSFGLHKKSGKPDSIKVRYWCGFEHFDEWLCFDHGEYPAKKAVSWWLRHQAGIAPRNTHEAIARVAECKKPDAIIVRKEGTYWRVVA